MIIESMKVREAITVIFGAGSRFQVLMDDTWRKDDDAMNGKKPWFTGLKGFLVNNPVALQTFSHDDVVYGPVKFCGQWIWYNPQKITGKSSFDLYVSVPPTFIRPDLVVKGQINPVPKTEGLFEPGECFEIGENFIDLNDDLNAVREQILAGYKRILELAAKREFIQQEVAQ